MFSIHSARKNRRPKMYRVWRVLLVLIILGSTLVSPSAEARTVRTLPAP